MTLRTRIAVIAAVAVALAVLATSVGAYVATARTLQAGTDRELSQAAAELLHHRARPGGFQAGARMGPFGRTGGFVQLIGRDGRLLGTQGDELPISERASELAASPRRGGAFYEDAEADGLAVRVLNVPIEAGVLRVAVPVESISAALVDLRRQLALGAVAGIALAAGLGGLVARRAVRPVKQLTELAEGVAETGDLSRRIQATGDDEVGRLARTFNGMLAHLEQARSAQQQLVADASHELRTPLTSLRTNIEVLEHTDRLTESSRRELIHDVVEQLAEFGRLVDGLVELARGAEPARGAVPVRLDEVVAAAAERARTFARDREFRLEATPTTVVAEADRLERAVGNLLDNAVKHGAGTIEIEVRDGLVSVRDHGPGVADADRAHVFDRFYRAPEARAAPGSGLGLSIVEQVATSHGGEATVTDAPGGGALFTLRLPTVQTDRELTPAT